MAKRDIEQVGVRFDIYPAWWLFHLYVPSIIWICRILIFLGIGAVPYMESMERVIQRAIRIKASPLSKDLEA